MQNHMSSYLFVPRAFARILAKLGLLGHQDVDGQDPDENAACEQDTRKQVTTGSTPAQNAPAAVIRESAGARPPAAPRADPSWHMTRPFATRTCTPEPEPAFFDESRYPRGSGDVYQAAWALRWAGLPAELVAMTLEMAEYWPVARFSGAGTEQVDDAPEGVAYYVTPRLRPDQPPTRHRGKAGATATTTTTTAASARVHRVVFTVYAREKTVRGAPRRLVRPLAPTWFEAHVRKRGVEDRHYLLRPPDDRRYRLIENRQNYARFKTQRAELSRYDRNPLAADLVRDLERGDRIVFTAHALDQDSFVSCNVIKWVNIDVYYSFF